MPFANPKSTSSAPRYVSARPSNVANARHETNLMIDEDQRGILGSQRFVGTHLITLLILLPGLMLVSVSATG